MNDGSLDANKAVRIILVSGHAGRLLRKKQRQKLDQFLQLHPNCDPDDISEDVLCELFDDIIDGICDDKNLSYYIESADDPDTTGAGPWPATIYGFGGIWLFRSPELDDLYFDDINDAMAHLYDCAHEVISKEQNYPLRPWQTPL